MPEALVSTQLFKACSWDSAVSSATGAGASPRRPHGAYTIAIYMLKHHEIHRTYKYKLQGRPHNKHRSSKLARPLECHQGAGITSEWPGVILRKMQTHSKQHGVAIQASQYPHLHKFNLLLSMMKVLF